MWEVSIFSPGVMPAESPVIFEEVRLPIIDKSPLEVSCDVDCHRVSLTIDASSVVVANVVAADMTAAQHVASETAERFLDWVSYKHGFSTKLKHGGASGRSRDTLTGKTTHHIAATLKLGVSVSHRIQGTAPDGTAYDSKRPGHVAFSRTNSMRYYRSAAVASGSFDKFRNYYLAAENAASVLAPEVRLDKQRFLQGIDLAFGANSHELTRMAAEIDASHAVTSTREIGALLYERYRCALNHSKESEPKLLPLQAADEAAVQRALPLMKRVAQHIIRAELAKSSPGKAIPDARAASPLPSAQAVGRSPQAG